MSAMVTSPAADAPHTGRTRWRSDRTIPLRTFLRTEAGSSLILVAAAVAALVWDNLDSASYDSVWHTQLAISVRGATLGQDLRGWVNSGLMTLFFFVVGLEARRELDMGDLRERRRTVLPVLAGLAGMLLPVLIYLGFNAGREGVGGWGIAMSTDTALALGMLALVGPRFRERLRAFMLTVLVVDDIVALCVIAFAYSDEIRVAALLPGVAIFAAVLLLRTLRVRHGAPYGVLGVAMWIALFESGVDPVVVGLAMGLIAYAYPARRSALERASERFRSFREQPTAALARQAQAELAAAVSPNLRMQQLWLPWTSYAVVPLFALANAGIPVSGDFLAAAFRSPITLGVLVGYAVGKPVGIAGLSWLLSRFSRGALMPPVGWASVIGAGTIAGMAFTVSLLIASLAFSGVQLDEAKLGVLSAALLGPITTLLVFRSTELLPRHLRVRAILGTAESLVDLAEPVDDERDHIRGPADAPVTMVEYGDFECPYCGRAEPVVREVLADFGDVRYVWRHLPLTDVHPHAQQAAEAAEAAALQGAFWPMHDLLMAHQDALTPADLLDDAKQLGLDVERFRADLREHTGAGQVAADVESADLSNVSGTPTFFVNGRRHHGAYDVASLSRAVRAARARAGIGGRGGPGDKQGGVGGEPVG